MAARLGLVFYWTGNLLGGLLLALGIYWGLQGGTDAGTMFFFFAIPALVVYLIGRAIKFVLAGG